MKRFILLFLVFPAMSFLEVSHYTISPGYTLTQALNLEKKKLYLGGTSAQAISIINLDENGYPKGEPIIYPTDTNCLCMGFFENKLYVGNNQDGYLYIYNLDEDGLIVGTPTKLPVAISEGMGAYSIVIDPERKKLYVGNMSGENDLCIYSLDKDGNPIGQPHFFTAVGYITSIALNPVHNKLYFGSYGGVNPFVCGLNNDGSLTGGGWSFNSGNLTYSLALDIEKRRLYMANNSHNDLSVVKLDNNGIPQTYTTYSYGGPSVSVVLCKKKKKLYVGKNQSGNNLYIYELDEDGDIKGTPTSYPCGGPTFSLLLGEKLYVGNYSGGNNLSILEENGKPFVSINNGATMTATQDIEILLFSSNPHWVKVTGDIVGKAGWTMVNGGKKRIKAKLTPKEGNKKVCVYFLESSGFGNYTACLKKKEVSIFLKTKPK
ncbi:TPA: hypothetical protein DCX16_03780 [bacterium]|nr:hypothetical protein [bacterium]